VSQAGSSCQVSYFASSRRDYLIVVRDADRVNMEQLACDWVRLLYPYKTIVRSDMAILVCAADDTGDGYVAIELMWFPFKGLPL
jgi:hypothetical protein